MAEKRRAKRQKKRFTCELWIDGKRAATGIILDVSSTGMFVKTNSRPAPGTEIEIRIDDRGLPEMRIRARVARQVRVDRRLMQLAAAGVGLEILDAPDDYALISGAGTEPIPEQGDHVKVGSATAPSQPPAPEPAAETQPFKVRVTLGARSRTVTVDAPDEERARAAALDKVGDDWEVIEVKAA